MGCAHSKTPQELEAEAALAAATEFVDAKLAGDGGSWILGFVERLRGEESEDMSEKARDFLIQSRLQSALDLSGLPIGRDDTAENLTPLINVLELLELKSINLTGTLDETVAAFGAAISHSFTQGHLRFLETVRVRENYNIPVQSMRPESPVTSLSFYGKSLTDRDMAIITALICGGVFFAQQGMRALANLKRIELDYNPEHFTTAEFPRLAWALSQSALPSLETLRLDYPDSGELCIKQIVEEAGPSGDGSLSYRNKNLGVQSAVVIAKALELNPRLTNADLSSNRLCGVYQKFGGDRWVDVGVHDLDGIREIGDALKKNQGLTKLDLSGSFLGGEGSAIVADGLRANAKLTFLSLEQNFIGVTIQKDGRAALSQAFGSAADVEFASEGICKVVDALSVNTALTRLNLRDNCLGPDAGSALGHLLKANATLKRLFLGKNRIGPAGGVALAAGLKENRALSLLELSMASGAGMGIEGCVAIVKALEGNTTLARLDLNRNVEWTGEGTADLTTALCDVIRQNSTLVELIIGPCHDETSRGAIAAAFSAGPDRAVDDLMERRRRGKGIAYTYVQNFEFFRGWDWEANEWFDWMYLHE
jgi:hypothetical protein